MKIPYILVLYIALEKKEKMPYYPVLTGLTNMIFYQNPKEWVAIQSLRGFLGYIMLQSLLATTPEIRLQSYRSVVLFPNQPPKLETSVQSQLLQFFLHFQLITTAILILPGALFHSCFHCHNLIRATISSSLDLPFPT